MTQPMPAQDILANTKIWFTRIRPEPNDQHFHSQLGCHFEEIHEMLLELEPVPEDIDGDLLSKAVNAIDNLAAALKAAAKCGETMVTIRDRVKFLDSVCDQIVTVTGVAHCAKMDPLNGMMEVNKSNYSKFGADGRPIYDENMKMTKGPDYVEANLIPYV